MSEMYQLGHADEISADVLGNVLQSRSIDELLEGKERSSISDDLLSDLPTVGWRLIQDSLDGRETWAAPAVDGWRLATIAVRTDGIKQVAAYFNDVVATPCRRIRRTGLTLSPINSEVEVEAGELRRLKLEYAVHNESGQIWKNAYGDRAVLFVRAKSQPRRLEASSADDPIPDLEAGADFMAYSKIQEPLTPGEYTIEASIVDLGLPAVAPLQLRITK